MATFSDTRGVCEEIAFLATEVVAAFLETLLLLIELFLRVEPKDVDAVAFLTVALVTALLLTLLADLLGVLVDGFLEAATFLAGAFLFGTLLAATFLAGAFWAGVLFVSTFLVTTLFAAAFFATAFLAVADGAGAFLAGTFLATALEGEETARFLADCVEEGRREEDKGNSGQT